MTGIHFGDEPLGTIERVRLEPGDVLVVSVPFRVTREHAALYRDRIQAHFPGHDVVIIGDGGRLGIVKPDQVNEPEACPHGRTEPCATCIVDGHDGHKTRGD